MQRIKKIDLPVIACKTLKYSSFCLLWHHCWFRRSKQLIGTGVEKSISVILLHPIRKS